MFMEINWQDIFYFTSSLAMVVFLIACIWLMWFFFIASKLIKNLTITANRWGNIVDELKYFKETVKINFSKFILKVLSKETKKI